MTLWRWPRWISHSHQCPLAQKSDFGHFEKPFLAVLPLNKQLYAKCLLYPNKASLEVSLKNVDFIFLNKIEVCHQNNHNCPKNEQMWSVLFGILKSKVSPFGMVLRYKIGKEWDLICGADDVCRWTINNEIHCSYA